jgi:nucleotide sugar dehydrogenase
MTNIDLSELVVLASPHDSTIDTIKRIAQGKVAFYGIAVIIDESGHVQGIINDGDILRLIANGTDLTQSVENLMVKNPITVGNELSHEEIIENVQTQLRRKGLRKEAVRYVLVVDENDILVNIFRFTDLLRLYKGFGEKVAIYGQGFVGLTLAAVLANRGHKVTGLDVQENIVKDLNQGKIHIHEPRLKDMVNSSLEQGTLRFKSLSDDFEANIFIVAVGTPLDSNGREDLTAVTSVCAHIAERLKRGDIVFMRSTVPVGITREIVVPILENQSGYRVGHDFYLSFTPERTAQGNAISELRKLPQIVGGFTPVCAQKSAIFWGTITDTVVHVGSLEAAEMIKLINNSFRDLSFAFSNSVALLCDRYNIDAFQLINAANEGYARNHIPAPSPGVGGYCLTKDPYLFANIDPQMGHSLLATSGRKINDQAAIYPVQALKRYAQNRGAHLSSMKILIIGLAFKGWPETNDMRGSISLQVAQNLKKEGCTIWGWDAVISPTKIFEAGIIPVEIDNVMERVDAVLILNNHPYNTQNGFISKCKNRNVFIFDGWSMLDAKNIEQHHHMTYATMGYMTKSI